MNTTYDAIVIGTGQSGPSLAVKLAAKGRKTAIIERKLIGGTCVNVGCIPSKTLIASARAAHVARRAAEFGVVLQGEVKVDMARVKARKDAVVKQSHDGVTGWLEGTKGLTVIRGHARFEGPNEIRVNGERLTAKEIFLDVGARATVPSIPGLDAIPYMTNTSIMDLDALPEHLVILGGSYIALEFAQMYRRFGSNVTVVERGPRILSREDDDVSATVQTILEGEGVRFRTSTDVASIEPRTGASRFSVTTSSGAPIEGTHLLLAVGRTPNTDDLGIEKSGIALDRHGYVTVDDELRTNVPGIWAMGDVNGRGGFTHTSYNDYEIVAANLLENDPRRVSDRITAYAVYTDPPLARIGMTMAEVKASVATSGKKALVGTMQMARIGRARERSETQGFLRVLVDAESKKILGASLLGIEADEVVHLLLDVMYAGAPYTVIQRAVHIHPTVSELVPTLLGDLKPLT